MSKPIVVIACMSSSSESWGSLDKHPHLRHARAGGEAVHSINTGNSSLVKALPLMMFLVSSPACDPFSGAAAMK